MAKKQPFFDFSIFSKTVHTIRTNFFLQLFYIIIESYMCNGIKIVWLECEKQPKLAQKWPKLAQKWPKLAQKQPFFDIFGFFQKLSIRFERNFLQSFYTILESYMCNGIKIVWLECEKQPKLAQKWPKLAQKWPKLAQKQPFFDIFGFFQKLSIRFERNFLQSFYTILESYMCNDIKIVWLGCEKHSQS